jgi:hypothetical protein
MVRRSSIRTRGSVLALAAAVLVAGACSGSDPSTIDLGSASTTTSPAAGGSATTATGPSPTGSRPPGTIVVGGTDAVKSGPSPSPNASANGPGSAAGMFLRPSGSSRIVVQVLTQTGAEPARATVDRVVDVLRSASGKPVTTSGGTVAATHDAWSPAELRDAADAVPASAPSGAAVLRILFLHGRSDKGDDVLGISVRGDLAAIFSDRVAASDSALVGAGAIERAVTTHEVGHLLGLVDLFLATGRADKDHPGHSTNRESVMYWAVESTLVSDLLTGGPPQDFDAADLADLATIRRE